MRNTTRKVSATAEKARTATFLVYDGMWRSGGIQSIIIRTIKSMSMRGEAVWLVTSNDKQVIGLHKDNTLDGNWSKKSNWLNSSEFSDFDIFKIVAFGPLAAAQAYLLKRYLTSQRRDASISVVVNVTHPHEYMMKNEKAHVHFLNRFLIIMLGSENFVFMNEQCRATHSAFLSRDLSANRIVPVPIDARKPRWIGSSTNAPLRIVSVGRIVNFKAYNFALPRILAEISKNGHDVICDIFGYGSEEIKLTKLIQQYDVDNFMTFHGPIEFDNFDDIVSGYDLFIGMGTAALQSAQLGVPTILAIVGDERGTHGFIASAPFGNLGEEDPSSQRWDMKEVIEQYISATNVERKKISKEGIEHADRYVSEDYVSNLTQSSIIRKERAIMLSTTYCKFYLWMSKDNWLRKSMRFLKLTRRGFERS